MDFIERILGISPDGGSGSLEMLWIAAVVAAIGTVIWRRRRGDSHRIDRTHEPS